MKTTEFKQFVRQPFAWPGGYPLFAVMNDGGAVCRHCAKENAKTIIRATRDNDRSGWNCTGVDVNWEDVGLTCEHCGKPIESAYGED